MIAGAAEFGNGIGRRNRGAETRGEDFGTLTAAALGLVALLLAFSFSIALSRFDARRDLVLQQANAIGSMANVARMLPEVTQGPVLGLFRDYAAIRVALGVSEQRRERRRSITGHPSCGGSYHVPAAVMAVLIGVAMGFTRYNSGLAGAKRRLPHFIMSLTIAVLIMLVLDLDDPSRGLIRAPVQPLLDTARGIGP